MAQVGNAQAKEESKVVCQTKEDGALQRKDEPSSIGGNARQMFEANNLGGTSVVYLGQQNNKGEPRNDLYK